MLILSAESQQSSELAVSLSVDGLPSAGENISLCVTVTNQSSRPRLLTEHLNAQLKAFNSHPERSFWKTHKEVRVRPGEGEENIP